MIIFLLGACSIPETQPDMRWQHAEQGAFAADISSSGKWVVSSSVSNGIYVWSIGDSEPTYTWRHQGEGNNIVTTVHISADERYVVTADRDAFALWSMASGEPEGFWRIDESTIRDIAVANNGEGILVARSTGKIMYFEPQTSRRLEFLGHQEKVNSIDISPNGRYALSGGNDYVALLWDTRSGQIVHRFEHDSRVTRVAIDDNGRYVFTADSKRDSVIWDVQTGERISRLKYSSRQKIFTTAVFSPDGQYLLTGSPAKRMHMWSVNTGEKVAEWKVAPRAGSQPATSVVYGVGFLPDGAILSSSSAGITANWGKPVL